MPFKPTKFLPFKIFQNVKQANFVRYCYFSDWQIFDVFAAQTAKFLDLAIHIVLRVGRSFSPFYGAIFFDQRLDKCFDPLAFHFFFFCQANFSTCCRANVLTLLLATFFQTNGLVEDLTLSLANFLIFCLANLFMKVSIFLKVLSFWKFLSSCRANFLTFVWANLWFFAGQILLRQTHWSKFLTGLDKVFFFLAAKSKNEYFLLS